MITTVEQQAPTSAAGTRLCQTIVLSAEDVSRLGRALEVTINGAPLPHQLDVAADGSGELVVLAPNRADIEALDIKSAHGKPVTPALLGIESIEDYEGQETFRIDALSCTYYFHKKGGGFASVIDRDGNDWLSFRPWGGSDGRYRGIPNLAHPENVFHPGAETCVSKLVAAGPLRITIRSKAINGGWVCQWHIYPDHAELTVIDAGHPYWLLYEGTPAGALDEGRDFCLRSDGLRRPLAERWHEVLPSPKWICFGKTGVSRVLFLASHSAENADRIDSYWPMEGNMTVFGFGRRELEKHLTHTPATFSFGLCETADFDKIKQFVERLMAATPAHNHRPSVPSSGKNP